MKGVYFSSPMSASKYKIEEDGHEAVIIDGKPFVRLGSRVQVNNYGISGVVPGVLHFFVNGEDMGECKDVELEGDVDLNLRIANVDVDGVVLNAEMVNGGLLAKDVRTLVLKYGSLFDKDGRAIAQTPKKPPLAKFEIPSIDPSTPTRQLLEGIRARGTVYFCNVPVTEDDTLSLGVVYNPQPDVSAASDADTEEDRAEAPTLCRTDSRKHMLHHVKVSGIVRTCFLQSGVLTAETVKTARLDFGRADVERVHFCLKTK